MEDKVKVSKQFLLDGHEAACADWKERIEKEVPELFEKFEVGDWVKSKGCLLVCITQLPSNVNKDRFLGYGFTFSGDWISSDYFGSKNGVKWEKATPAEVKAALEKECIRRYGEDWKNVKIKIDAYNGRESDNDGLYPPVFDTYMIWNKNGCLFYKGEWAEKKEEVELEVGRWYQDRDGDVFFVEEWYSKGKNKAYGYGFLHGCWEERPKSKGTKYCFYSVTPASKETVEKALIAEAKRRGFKVGVRFQPFGYYPITTIGRLDFRYWDISGDVSLHVVSPQEEWEESCSNPQIFKNGKWATIIPAKEQSNENIKATIASIEKQLEELKKQVG